MRAVQKIALYVLLFAFILAAVVCATPLVQFSWLDSTLQPPFYYSDYLANPDQEIPARLIITVPKETARLDLNYANDISGGYDFVCISPTDATRKLTLVATGPLHSTLTPSSFTWAELAGASFTCDFKMKLNPRAVFYPYFSAQFNNIPNADGKYAIAVYAAGSVRIGESQPIELPAITRQVELTPLTSSCYDQEFCSLRMTIKLNNLDLVAFSGEYDALPMVYLNDFFNVEASFATNALQDPNLVRKNLFVCTTDDNFAILTLLPIGGNSHAGSLSPTYEYLQYIEHLKEQGVTTLTQLECTLTINTPASLAVQFVHAVDQDNNLSLFALPPISKIAPIIAHTRICYVGTSCSYTLEFSEEFIKQYPLLRFSTLIPAEYSVTNNDYCVLNQFGQDILLQISRDTPIIAEDGSVVTPHCTLQFFPKIAYDFNPKSVMNSIHLDNLATLDGELNSLSRGLINVNIFLPNATKFTEYYPESNADKTDLVFQDFSTFFAQLPYSTSLLNPDLYDRSLLIAQHSAPHVHFRLPFSLVTSPTNHAVTMSLPTTDSCQGAKVCELKYFFNSILSIQRLKHPNIFRWTDASERYACKTTGDVVLAYLRVLPTLDWVVLETVNNAGLNYGTCSAIIPVRVIVPPQTVDTYYQTSILQYFPNSDFSSNTAYYNIDEVTAETLSVSTTSASLPRSDTLTYPYFSPFKLVALNVFITPYSRTNYVTFQVLLQETDIVIKTKRMELEFLSKDAIVSPTTADANIDIYEVGCFIPNWRQLTVAQTCTTYVNATSKRGIVLEFSNGKSDSYYTPNNEVTFSTGRVPPTLLYNVFFDYEYLDPITNEMVVGRYEQRNVNSALPALPANNVLMAPSKQPTTPSTIALPSTPESNTAHTIYLYTNHITTVNVGMFPNGGALAGAFMIFELYYTQSQSAFQTPLRWTWNNLNTLAPLYGFTVMESDPNCLYCVTIRLNIKAVQISPSVPAWYATGLMSNLPIDILYQDSYSSWQSTDQVHFSVKVKTTFAATQWALMSRQTLKQYHDHVYTLPYLPTIHTYNYDIKSQLTLKNGLNSPLVKVVYDSTGAFQPTDNIVMVNIQPYAIMSKMSDKAVNIKTISYQYTFTGCSPYTYLTTNTSNNVCSATNIDTDNDVISVSCEDPTLVQTNFQFVIPPSTFHGYKCKLTTTFTVTYTNNALDIVPYDYIISFVPVIEPNTFTFNKGALICNQTDLPVFATGGPGVYTIRPPNTSFKLTPITTDEYSLVVLKTSDNSYKLTVFNHDNNKKTTQNENSGISITAFMTCPTGTLDGVHLLGWSWTFTSLTSSTSTLSSIVYPVNGYYLYTPLGQIQDFFSLRLKLDGNFEYISATLTETYESEMNFKLLSSFNKDYTLGIFPPPSLKLNLFGLNNAQRFVQYKYQTHGYNDAGEAVEDIEKITDVEVYYSTDGTRVNLRFSDNIEMYNFNQWFPYSLSAANSNNIVTSRDTSIEGFTTSITFLSKYDNYLYLNYCYLGNACTTFSTTQRSLKVFDSLSLSSFTFNADVNNPNPSIFQLSREVAVGDFITIRFVPTNIADGSIATDAINMLRLNQTEVDYKTGDGSLYSVKIFNDVTNQTFTTIQLSFNSYFIPYYSFSIPTAFDSMVSDLFIKTYDATTTQLTAEVYYTYLNPTINQALVSHLPLGISYKIAALKAQIVKPILNFNFPSGFSFASTSAEDQAVSGEFDPHDEVTFEFTISRPLNSGQTLMFSPLPFKHNLNRVGRMLVGGQYVKFQLTTSTTPINIEDAFTMPNPLDYLPLVQLSITPRTDIPPGTTLSFSFPPAALTKSQIEEDKMFVATENNQYAIFATSNGFGNESSTLPAYNLLKETSLTHRSIEYSQNIVFTVNLVSNDLVPDTENSFLPCRVGTVCELSLSLKLPFHDDLPLHHYQYFDIVFDFVSQNAPFYRMDPVPPVEYDGMTVTTGFGYQYTYIYSTTSLIIAIRATDPELMEESSLQNIPLFINFASLQQDNNGALDISIVKYSSLADATLGTGGAVVCRDRQVKGPTVVSDLQLQQAFFYYIDGGLFVDEVFQIGFSPAVPLTYNATLYPQYPQASTLTAQYSQTSSLPDEWVSTFGNLVGIMSTMGSAQRQMKSQILNSRPSPVLFEVSDVNSVPNSGFSFVLSSIMPSAESDSYTIRPAVPDSAFKPTSPIDFTDGFTLSGYGQDYSLGLIAPVKTPTIPTHTLSQLNSAYKFIQTTQKIPGFRVRRTPWVRINTMIAPVNSTVVDNTVNSIATLPMDTTVKMSLFITIKFPLNPDTDTPYLADFADVITVTLPSYYTVTAKTYNCIYSCSAEGGLCSSWFDYDGNRFTLRFDTDALTAAMPFPTQLICSFETTVYMDDFYSSLAKTGQSAPFPEFTRSYVDFRSNETFSYLRPDTNGIIVPFTPSSRQLPSVSSTDSISVLHPDLQVGITDPENTIIRDEFLAWFAPMPIHQTLLDVELEDMVFTGIEGKIRFKLINATLSSVMQTKYQFKLPVLLEDSIQGLTCRNENTNEAIGSIVFVGNIADSSTNITLSILLVPQTQSLFTCAATITPIAPYAHYFITQTNIPANALASHGSYSINYPTTARLSFVSTDLDSEKYKYIKLRAPEPQVSISASFVETMTTKLTFVGIETTIKHGDVLVLSLGTFFKPSHANWHDVYCIQPSNDILAKVTFQFNTKDFTLDPSRSDSAHDANPLNVGQFATSLTLTFLLNDQIISPDAQWECSLYVVATTTSTSTNRKPSAYQRSIVSSSAGKATNTISYIIDNQIESDALSAVDFALKYDNSAPTSVSSALVYFNSTELQHQSLSASPPIMYISLPRPLTSTPNSNLVLCRLNDYSIAPQYLPFQQIQTTSLSSIYSVPIDRYISLLHRNTATAKATNGLSWVKCFFATLKIATMEEVEDKAKIELGSSTSTLYSAVSFSMPSIPKFSITTSITPDVITVRSYDNIDTRGDFIPTTTPYTVNSVSLVNNAPTALNYTLTNIEIGQSVNPAAVNTDAVLTPSGTCVGPDGTVYLEKGVSGKLIATTSSFNNPVWCTHKLSVSFMRTLTSAQISALTQNCANSANPVYCSYSSRFGYEIGNNVQYFNSLISFQPYESITYIPTHYFASSEVFYQFSLSGYYPGSTLTFDVNVADVVMSDIKFQFLMASTYQSLPHNCVQDEVPNRISCILNNSFTPFWANVIVQFYFRIDGYNPRPDGQHYNTRPFTAVLKQAPNLPPHTSTHTYTVNTSLLTVNTLPSASFLMSTDLAPHFSDFLQNAPKNPYYVLVFPSDLTSTGAIGSGSLLGRTYDYGFSCSLTPQHFEALTIPFMSFTVDTTKVSLHQYEQISSILSSPFPISYRDDDDVTNSDYFLDTLTTRCFDKAFSITLQLFDIQVSTQVVDDSDLSAVKHTIYLKMLPHFQNFFQFIAKGHQFATLGCEFPLAFMRDDITILPPYDLPTEVQDNLAASQRYNVTGFHQMSEHYAITTTKSVIQYNPVYNRAAFTPYILGAQLFHGFGKAFYTTNTTQIVMDPSALILGSYGHINITIHQSVLNVGDVLLITFTPTVVDKKDVFTKDDENLYTGTSTITELAYQNKLQYDSIAQQRYSFTTPTTVEQTSTPCYNLAYNELDGIRRQQIGTLSPLSRTYKPFYGDSDMFLLNLTDVSHVGSSFLFNYFTCQALIMGVRTHPFDGVITAKYLTAREYQNFVYDASTAADSSTVLPSIVNQTQVGVIQNPITTGFDIVTTITPATLSKQIVNLTIAVSASPEQHDIFITVNLTNIKFQSFYGCDILRTPESENTVIIADYYPPMIPNTIVNTLFADSLRVYISTVRESTQHIQCSFLSSAITPRSYRTLLEAEQTSIFTDATAQANVAKKIATRPAFPVETKAYKLLSKAIYQSMFDKRTVSINDNPIVTKRDAPKLQAFVAPSNIEELSLIEFFKLTPISSHITQYQTTMETPDVYANSVICVWSNRSPAAPFLSYSEQVNFLDNVHKHIAFHVTRGIFMQLNRSSLHILSQSYDPSTKFLTIDISYVPSTNDPLWAILGETASDSYQALDTFIDRFIGINATGLRSWADQINQMYGTTIWYDPTTVDGITTEVPRAIDTTQTPAFFFGPHLSTKSLQYNECLVGRTGANCGTSPNGYSCSRNDDCQSSYCYVDSFSTLSANKKNSISATRAVQYGVISDIGTCIPLDASRQSYTNNVINISTAGTGIYSNFIHQYNQYLAKQQAQHQALQISTPSTTISTVPPSFMRYLATLPAQQRTYAAQLLEINSLYEDLTIPNNNDTDTALPDISAIGQVHNIAAEKNATPHHTSFTFASIITMICFLMFF